MKIYCSRQSSLSKIVGKDAWILCKLRKKSGPTKFDFWVRIYAEYADTYLVALVMATDRDDRRCCGLRSKGEMDTYMSMEKKEIPKSRIYSIIIPEEIVTTDELFSSNYNWEYDEWED